MNEMEPIVSQTDGFVGADGSAVRGSKKKKSQIRMKDKKALSQLQLIGDVSQAKYRFLSETFMRRHGLGSFAAESKSDTDGQSVSQRKKKRRKQTVQDIEPESDAEWIV